MSSETITVRGETYSRQDCLDDLKSVSTSFPERKITRDFFRRHGEIPEAAWSGMFGSFQEFLRAAGLEPSRLEREIQRKAALHASMDAVRVVSEQRLAYGDRYVREKNSRYKTLIACSDLHDKDCDPFYMRVLEETTKQVRPDVVCVNGDLYDSTEFGKYTVDPREWDVVGRFKAANEILRRLREAAPDAQIDLIEGNHEARVVRYFAEQAPPIMAILSDLHNMTLSEFFGLDQYEINYVGRATLNTFSDSQLKREIERNYRVYWNSVMAHHHPEGRNYSLPGFNGHHHQHIVWSMHNSLFGSYEWHQLGSGHIRQAPYCDGSKWNNGFLIVNVDTHTNSVVFDYVTVGRTFAIAGGTWFYRDESEFYPALMEELDQEPFGAVSQNERLRSHDQSAGAASTGRSEEAKPVRPVSAQQRRSPIKRR